MTKENCNAELEHLVRQLLDDDAIKYLHNKHRGGSSGAKGSRYEDLFAVVKIAEISRDKGGESDNTSVCSQAPHFFVDDLVISEAPRSVQSCHQLKNSSNVSWTGGDHPIALDFERQYALSRAAGFATTSILLVVSDPASAEELARDIPENIRPFTSVKWFPWETSAVRLCELWPDQLEALAWLSKHEKPDFNQLSEVLSILLGSWVALGGEVSVQAVIDRARNCSPTLIRPLIADCEVEATVRQDFIEILAKINHFSYSMVKGFFTWAYCPPNGTETRGVYPQDCLSGQFANFQERVVKRRPLTFDEMEEEL